VDEETRRYQSKSVRVLAIGIPLVFLLFLAIPAAQAPLAIALALALVGIVLAILAFLGLRRQAIEVVADGVWIRKLARNVFVPIDRFDEIRLVPGAPAVILTREVGKVRVIQTSAITSMRGSQRSREVNQVLVDEINRSVSGLRGKTSTKEATTD